MVDNIYWPLRDVWPELVEQVERLSLLYAGRNPNSVLYLPENELIDIINEQISLGKELIVLDNSHETFIESEISKVYEILPKLNVTSDKIYYLTTSADAVGLHDWLRERNNWTSPITLVVLNIFEFAVRDQSTFDHSISYVVRKKERKFLCFNRMPHLHRVCLLGLMLENNLVDQAYYSFYDSTLNVSNGITVCTSDDTNNALHSRLSTDLADRIITRVQSYATSLPLQLTLDEFGSNPVSIDPDDATLFANSYFSIIPETYFFKNSFLNELNTVFITEKTYKTILMKHPFIIAGMPKSLSHLRDSGYRTFHPYIDESYDDIYDDEQRLLSIMNEVNRLCNMTDEDFIEWQENIKEIVEYNYQTMLNRPVGPLNGVTLRKNNDE